jgi:hypothetical protein
MSGDGFGWLVVFALVVLLTQLTANVSALLFREVVGGLMRLMTG